MVNKSRLFTVIISLLFFLSTLQSCQKSFFDEDIEDTNTPEIVETAKLWFYSNVKNPSKEHELNLNNLKVEWNKYVLTKNNAGQTIVTAPISNYNKNIEHYTELSFMINHEKQSFGLVKLYIGDLRKDFVQLYLYTIDGKLFKKGIYNTKSKTFRIESLQNKISNNSKKKSSLNPKLVASLRLECPSGLVFNPTINVCDFPKNVLDDWKSPFYWKYIYDDGSYDYGPAINEIDEVIVPPPSNSNGSFPSTGGGRPFPPGNGNISPTSGGGIPVSPGNGELPSDAQQRIESDNQPNSTPWRNLGIDIFSKLNKITPLYILNEYGDEVPNPDAYNCHYYSFQLLNPDDSQFSPAWPYWANIPNTSGYVRLEQGSLIQVNDRIIYFTIDSKGKYGVSHSGIVIEVINGYATKVSSKMGEYEIIEHHPRDIPAIYGLMQPFIYHNETNKPTRVYYRRK
ncbi:Uncharacterised protein [Sphingobacterium spiritivorum]|uniref:Peptidase C51 domain-containing protein n=1 Tax=Sphingobacterium spiritivorum TaxID=258 RepID=A0A380BJV6_SPHSI|nr:chitin binding peritrophin-A domain-containing protein [Sphingobacterium spiritivorum]SUJ01613.1 Uncharacterised protein [Sphingobacterium spiritivorum]